MQDLSFVIEETPKSEDIGRLERGLNEHAIATIQSRGFSPLAVLARNPGSELVAGAYGQINWNWLFVSLLWVSSDRRHQGLGSRLLGELEAAATARGCRHAHLDTFSFQARRFYERHGYDAFATLEEYPPGHERLFLRKRLPA